MVVHTCNPRFGKLSQEDGEFRASLGYIAGRKVVKMLLTGSES